MKVSVIIPTQNRMEELRRCLTSVFQQESREREVLVVDNGSEDGTVEMLVRDFPEARIIRNSSNVGACAARNQALAVAEGEYVWFLDSDSEAADPRCLSNMLAMIESDENIGSVGGEFHEDDEEGVLVRVKRVLPNGETVNEYVPSGEAERREGDYLATCNCLARRQHLLEWGGFDEDYFFLSEDKELGHYLRSRGLRNIADASTAAYHRISTASGKRSLFLKLRNVVRFNVLHAPRWRLPLLPLLDFLYLFRGTKFRDLKSSAPHATKYVGKAGESGPDARRAPFAWRLAVAGARYLLALMGAYLWNLLHLSATLRVRRNRPDFIGPWRSNGPPRAIQSG